MENKIAIIYGTRPEFLKVYPIILECLRRKINFITINTGQHTNLVTEMEKRRCQIKCDDKGCLVNIAIDDLSTTVVRASPEWLRYSTDQFKQDLQVMLDGAKIA